MPHDLPLVTTLATSLGLALVLGFIATRLKLPALVGYLLAGILIGPFTPGLHADAKLAGELAEIGVMLLMFGVGLHFSLDDLMEVRKVALPGALLQMLASATSGACLALWWGWPTGSAIVFGLSMSIASTVVLLKALESRDALESMNGKISVGWLVVQDLVTVLVLVLLPPLSGALGGKEAAGGDGSLWVPILITLAKVAAFVAFMLIVGRRLFPKMLWYMARSGTRELFTLCVIAAAVSIAYMSSALFGVSFALGAFFAGIVMRESEFSHRAAEESLPLREAFAVLFFVSVGMLFDPHVLIQEPLKVLAVTVVIVLVNPLAAALIVLLFRYPLNTALMVMAGLAQIGEFSFILVGLGIDLGLLTPESRNLILAGSMISIALNSFMFRAMLPLRDWLQSKRALRAVFEQTDDPLATLPMTTESHYLSGQVVLVGYGRVGQRIADALEKRKIPFVVAEQRREMVERLRARGIAAVAGDAADPAVLIQAHVARAAMLVIATPDAFNVRQMIDTARLLNPGIETVLRTHSEDEAQLLADDAGAAVFYGEEELARGMARHVLDRFGTAL
ncbi:sodium:proton antiporter [Massilia arenosa]|uniref:Sodium:proton antiporter n=1 Tax=Zemynaea arenosa TaxID=2561931 RepID=A0A4Y9SET8_9BURK|nr:cation:proton antiporter [Massilia arenosa]TFW21248.1 sodium:proton antiporter [Massilia arenosa]